MTNFRIALMTLAAVLVLGLAACATGSGPSQSDLAQARDAASRYDVTIMRDSYGVPHITGATSADVAFGLGYAVGEDDFANIVARKAGARR